VRLLWPRRPAGAARFVGCAGKQQTAIQYDIGAAQRADALGAHCQAADLYTLALRHGADTPAEHNVVWLEQHAHTSYLGGLPAASSWFEAITLRPRQRANDWPTTGTTERKYLCNSVIR
jgi:hypothetical protein